MRTGSRIHSFHPGLQGPFIRMKHAVKYVQLTFSMGTWGKKLIERGFSDNKDILSNNMQDETLISYQMAYVGIKMVL